MYIIKVPSMNPIVDGRRLATFNTNIIESSIYIEETRTKMKIKTIHALDLPSKLPGFLLLFKF